MLGRPSDAELQLHETAVPPMSASASTKVKAVDELPQRAGPGQRANCSPGHLVFADVNGLVSAGRRRPLTVADAFTLPDSLLCAASATEFEALWAAECAAAEEQNKLMTAEARAASDALGAMFRAAQLGETEADEVVKAAADTLAAAEKAALHSRGPAAAAAAEVVAAAKERHAAAEVASRDAGKAVGEARVASLGSKTHPSVLHCLWTMCWREWVTGLLLR